MFDESNRCKYTKEMLDTIPDEWGMTIREYLKYGLIAGYIWVDEIDNMTDQEICEAIDFIEYLETK